MPNKRLPSTKLVLKVLPDGWMTQKSIARKTFLPLKTVKYSLKKLGEKKFIQKNLNVWDLRRSIINLRAKVVQMERIKKLLLMIRFELPGWPNGSGGGLQTRYIWVQLPSPAPIIMTSNKREKNSKN